MSRRLIKDTYIYGLGSLLSKSFGFLLIPIYTRYLTVAEYGALSIINLIIQFISFSALLGISSAAMRFYFESDSTEQDQKIVYGTAIKLLFILPIIVVLVSIPIIFLLGEKFIPSVPFIPYLLVAVLMGLFTPMSMLVYGMLRVQRRAITFISLNISFFLFQATTIVLAVAVFGYGLQGQIYSQLLAAMIFSGVALLLLKSYSRAPFSPDAARRMLKFGIPLVPFFLLGWINTAASRFFLERYLGLDDLGIFALAAQFGGLLLLASATLDNALLPHFLAEAGKNNGPQQMGMLVTRYLALTGLLGLATISIAGPAIRIMADSSFHEAIQYVGPLTLASWTFIAARPVLWSLSHSKKTSWLPLIRGSSALLLIILMLVLFESGWGINGAIIAMIAANLLGILIGFPLAQRYFSLHFSWLRLIAIIVLILGGGTAIMATLPDHLSFTHVGGQLALIAVLSVIVLRIAGINNPLVLIKPGAS